MNREKYEVVANSDQRSYEFYSKGPRGSIRKIILYKRLTEWNENIFNLGFGDWDEMTQSLNDKAMSNNNDRDKILATVASTVIDFTKRNPGAIIYAEGATPSRSRLYQMAIKAHLNEISKKLDVYGFRQGNWEAFQRSCNYEAFAVAVKKIMVDLY